MGSLTHMTKTLRGVDSTPMQSSRHEFIDRSNLQSHIRWGNYYYTRPSPHGEKISGDKVSGNEEKMLEHLRRKVPAIIHFNGEDGKAALKR